MTMRHLYSNNDDGVSDIVAQNIETALATLGACQEGFLHSLNQLPPSKDALAEYGLALVIETAEFVNEVPWKSWKPGMEPDVDRLVDEFADILAFVGTWVRLLEEFGVSEQDLAYAYVMKRAKNVERFAGTSGEKGYTGVNSET